MLMIEPPPARCRCGIPYFVTQKTDFRLIAMTRSHQRSSVSSTERSRSFHRTPALLCRTCSAPKRRTPSSTIRWTSASTATSPVTATAWPPAFSTRATVPFAASASMSATTIRAPSSAKSARGLATHAHAGAGDQRDFPGEPAAHRVPPACRSSATLSPNALDDALHVRRRERPHVRDAERVLPDVPLPGVDDASRGASSRRGAGRTPMPGSSLNVREDARAGALGHEHLEAERRHARGAGPARSRA